ncbi:MAG: hypothetical protein KDK99_04090, partial [Verrucomicrobiales bacterium]|nr:hypothetical protein [Verrucomicrobiales bacterium]
MKWFWVLIGWTATMALADDRAILLERFSQTEERGITIPPGDYILEGETPIPLPSNVTIQATGARFFFPDELPDRARRLMFAGENVSHLVWEGGEFVGRVFDPAEKVNSWLPNANTKGIEITTTEVGGTHDITFRNVRSHGVAGAVIGVHGWVEKGQETDVLAYAERVTIQDCTLLRSGKFMWDYG